MNRWTERHRVVLESALEPGETLRSADRVLLASASAVNISGPNAGQTRRLGGRRAGAALRAARAHGVELPGRAFVLAVTDQRLVVWRATTWLARPKVVATVIPRARVASLRGTGLLGFAKLRLLLDDGILLVLRPYGGRRLDHLGDAAR